MKRILVCEVCLGSKSFDKELLPGDSYCYTCQTITNNTLLTLREFDTLTRERKIDNIIAPKSKILVIDEKHGTRYMNANTNIELEESCRKILSERLAYYNGDFFQLAKTEISSPSGNAFKLLNERSIEGHEYEKIRIVEIEE